MNVLELFDNTYVLYFVAAVILCLLSYMLVHKKQRWSAIAIVVFFSFVLVGSHETIFNLLGKPRPTDIYFLTQSSNNRKSVLGMKQIPNVGIYLLLNYKGVDEPVYEVWPWDDARAEELQKAMEKSMKQFGRPDGFEIEGPMRRLPLGLFDPSLEEQPMTIHELPQPALEKDKGTLEVE